MGVSTTGSDQSRARGPASRIAMIPRATAGYGKIIGRVGALAVFLGVGTVIAVPAIAHADGDDPTSTETASTEAASTASESSSPRSVEARTPRWSHSPKTRPSSRQAARPDREAQTSEPDIAVKTPGAVTSGRLAERLRGLSDGKRDRASSTSRGPADSATDTAADTDRMAPSSAVQASSVTVRKPDAASTPPTKRPRIGPSPPTVEVSRPAPPAATEAIGVAPADLRRAAPEIEAASTPSPVVEAVSDVVSAVFAPLAGVGLAPGAPGQSPAEWALLAFARRQVGTDSAATMVTSAAAASTGQVGSTEVQQALVNQVSPLVTPEQLEAEKIAMRTANTLPVALMKLVLQHQFRSTAQQQFAPLGGVDADNLALLNTAVNQFALFSSFTQQLINPMTPAFIWADTPAHHWFGMGVGDSRYLYDNPDTLYRFTGVNKNASYVITGRFHNYDPNDPIGTLPADTTFSVVEGTSGETSSLLTIDQLDIAPDGTFVITVSGKPAAPGQANHIQLTSRSTVLLARNTLGDWNTEEPMSLSIAKVGGAPNSLFAQLGGFAFLGEYINDNPLLVSLVSLIPPLWIAEIPLVRGTLTAVIMVVRGGNEQGKYMALATTDPVTGQPRPANVIPQPTTNAEFLANQRQSIGNFRLADDEALVLVIDPGSAGYFTVPVYNVWTTTVDFGDQQTSLNNSQARANPDGTYTVVISPSDPGVYNWVSTGGLTQGIIAARFQDIDPDDPDAPSIVGHQVVSLSEVPDFYPADPAYFVDEQQRAAQLALRKAGYNKRFAPYLQV